MEKESKKIEKMCSFYVSDWHLATMLLPYINSKIDEKVKIIPILENNIQENIKTLVEKLNLKNEEKILNINWNTVNSIKYNEVENKLKREIDENTSNIILVNGCLNYIETNNENIEKWFKKYGSASIKIINFYEVTEFNNCISQILDEHDKVFNTSGEREIAEVFEGYVKGERLETKKVVGGSQVD